MSILKTTITAVTLTAATATSAQIYDNFSTPQWVAIASPQVSLYEQVNKLLISFNQGTNGAVFSGGYYSTCKLTGDFDISTDYGIPVYPDGNGVRIGLIVDVEQKNGVWFNQTWAAMERISSAPASSFYGADFSRYGSSGSMTQTTDTRGKFRLTRVGTTLTGYYWDWAAAAWISSNVTTSFTSSPVYFGLTAWSHDSVFGKVATKVSFDNMLINAGNCVPVS